MSDHARAADEAVTLRRDCAAITVPQGEPIQLSAGDVVRVVAARGGSFTVATEMGTLLRIDGEDADALGREPAERAVSLVGNGPFAMEQVTDALRSVYDPEIPVSIVDLGLIYRCEEVTTDEGGRRIEIDMTMTSPGCGMGDVLRDDALRVVDTIPGVDEVDVHVVFDPPWSLDRISEETRLELGLY